MRRKGNSFTRTAGGLATWSCGTTAALCIAARISTTCGGRGTCREPPRRTGSTPSARPSKLALPPRTTDPRDDRSKGRIMSKEPSSFVNVAMWHGGRYSTANRGAKEVIDGATPLVLDAIRRMPDTTTSSPFTLTDMGCADGGVSIEMIRRVAAAVRARWPLRPIVVVYADQPRNDYNSLFHLIHGLTPAPTYLDEIEDVYVLASASSFYRPIVPAGTLHLGFSASAMHWLSRKPCDLTNHIQAVGAAGAEFAAFAQHARRDWEPILLHRTPD